MKLDKVRLGRSQQVSRSWILRLVDLWSKRLWKTVIILETRSVALRVIFKV